MSGVAVVWYRLSNYAPLVALVGDRIMAGDLPLKLARPAIGVTQVSNQTRLTLSRRERSRFHTDRVQVTAFVNNQQGNPPGADYPGLVTIMRHVLSACDQVQHQVVNGITVDSILVDIEGPDIPIQETTILTRSRDFIVRYIEVIEEL